MDINVLLSGRLRLDGYGKGRPQNGDGTLKLTLHQGSTIREVIEGLDIPHDNVSMTMLNARKCDVSAPVQQDDRVILIPADVALLWRHLGMINLGAESVFDF